MGQETVWARGLRLKAFCGDAKQQQAIPIPNTNRKIAIRVRISWPKELPAKGDSQSVWSRGIRYRAIPGSVSPRLMNIL